MLIDTLTQFCKGTGLDTAVATDIVDMITPKNKTPEPLWWYVHFSGADASSAGATTITLQHSDTSGSGQVPLVVMTFTQDEMKKDTIFKMPVPKDFKRYLDVKIAASAADSGCKVTSWLGLMGETDPLDAQFPAVTHN